MAIETASHSRKDMGEAKQRRTAASADFQQFAALLRGHGIGGAMVARLIVFLKRRTRRYGPIEYATSSHETFPLPPPWSSLRAALSTHIARAIYVVPVAGYVILYSDYFERLFKFSALSSTWGFLTFTSRVNMIYYGSVTLLIAFGLFWLFSPPLLRNRGDRTRFVTDLVVSRDSSTVHQANRAADAYLRPQPIDRLLTEDQQNTLRSLLSCMNRGDRLGEAAGEYENLIPRILVFYYNWQNFRLPLLRTVIFFLVLIGYALLLLPSFDLFLRVLGTSLGHLANSWIESNTLRPVLWVA
jgi:hypothetical protein